MTILPTDITLLNHIQVYMHRVNSVLARVNTYRNHNTLKENTTLHITHDNKVYEITDTFKGKYNKVYEIKVSIKYSTQNRVLLIGNTISIREYLNTLYTGNYEVRYTDISKVLEEYNNIP